MTSQESLCLLQQEKKYIYINYIYTEKMYLKIKLLKHIYLIVYFFRALFADECQKGA